MKNNLKIIETKIDWLNIIKLAFDKKDWGKTYNLYVFEDIRITCNMYEFNFNTNSAIFQLNCEYAKDEHNSDWTNYEFLYYHLDNYSIEDFKLLVTRKIQSLIKEVINRRLISIAVKKFKSIKYELSDIDIKLIKKHNLIKDYKVINSIKDEKIKSESLNVFNEQFKKLLNKEYDSKVDKYIQNNQFEHKNLSDLLKQIAEDNK